MPADWIVLLGQSYVIFTRRGYASMKTDLIRWALGRPRRQKRTGMENLFSYGTLRDESIQQAVFGHSLKGAPDAIVGYRLVSITITDQNAIAISGKTVHQILEPTGRKSDQIEGTLFQLTAKDLQLADVYEDKAYKRVRVRLRSGVDAWVYVQRDGELRR
jgi:gamma-glutamylcyclotransferase (GGCT)/AIG2-like uncharacterized protein YtfP